MLQNTRDGQGHPSYRRWHPHRAPVMDEGSGGAMTSQQPAYLQAGHPGATFQPGNPQQPLPQGSLPQQEALQMQQVFPQASYVQQGLEQSQSQQPLQPRLPAQQPLPRRNALVPFWRNQQSRQRLGQAIVQTHDSLAGSRAGAHHNASQLPGTAAGTASYDSASRRLPFDAAMSNAIDNIGRDMHTLLDLQYELTSKMNRLVELQESRHKANIESYAKILEQVGQSHNMTSEIHTFVREMCEVMRREMGMNQSQNNLVENDPSLPQLQNLSSANDFIDGDDHEAFMDSLTN